MLRIDPRVRDLYRRILTVGRDYPKGLDYIRERAKLEFQNRADAKGGDLNHAINYGRFMVKEMIGVIQLKKYRTIKRRYEDDE